MTAAEQLMAEAVAAVEYVEDRFAAYLTESAERQRQATRDRDAAVIVASNYGWSLRRIAAETGLSHAGVKRIIDRND